MSPARKTKQKKRRPSVIPVHVKRDAKGNVLTVRDADARYPANDDLLNDVAVVDQFSKISESQFHYRQQLKNSGGWASLDGNRLTAYDRLILTGRGQRLVKHYLRSEVRAAVNGPEAAHGIYDEDGERVYNVTAAMSRLKCSHRRIGELETEKVLVFRKRTSPISYQTERVCPEAHVLEAERIILENRKTRYKQQRDRRKLDGDWYLSHSKTSKVLSIHPQTLTKYEGAVVEGEEPILKKTVGSSVWWNERGVARMKAALDAAGKERPPRGWLTTEQLINQDDLPLVSGAANAWPIQGRKSGELQRNRDWWQSRTVQPKQPNKATYWNPQTCIAWRNGEPAAGTQIERGKRLAERKHGLVPAKETRTHGKPVAQTPPQSAPDDDAYVPASALWRDEFGTYRKFKTWLKNTPETEVRRRRPRENRLELHAADWARHWDAVHKAMFDAADL